MEYYIAVFWSRAEALSFANNLRMRSIPSAIVPTPREAGRTCGLSVKILPEYLSMAKEILGNLNYSSFGGWIRTVTINGRYMVVKIK